MADPNRRREFPIPVSNMNANDLRSAYFSQMNTLGDSKAKLVKRKAYNLLLDTTTPLSATFVNDTKSLLQEVKNEFSKRGIPLPDYKPLRVRYAERKAIEDQERARRMRLSAGVRARSAAAPPVAAAGPPVAAGGEPRPVLSIPVSPPSMAAGGAGGGGGGAAESSSPGLPCPGPPMHPPDVPYNAPPKANSGCVVSGGRRRTHKRTYKNKNRKKRQSRKM